MTRRFQFSLRALLAVTTAVGLVLTWILLPIFQLRRQRQIADAFSRRGMEVEYDYDPRLSEDHPPGPAWARLLYGDNLYVNPVAVTWHGEPPSDDDLRLLSQLKHLRRLSLAGVAVNDRYLKKLGQLKNLEELDLHATAITDAGLEQLPVFPNLKRIYLAKTATHPRRNPEAPPSGWPFADALHLVVGFPDAPPSVQFEDVVMVDACRRGVFRRACEPDEVEQGVYLRAIGHYHLGGVHAAVDDHARASLALAPS